MPVTVREFLENLETGTVFIMDDIDTVSSRNSVKTQLSQECISGRIERVLQGVYYKPKYNEKLGLDIPCDIDSVAHAIAKNNHWHIIPGGDQCLNIFGLSTQVPARYVYLSDGPYKTYNVNGVTVEFKHRSPKNYPDDDLTAMMIQALWALGKDNCDDKTVEKLSRSVPDEKKATIIENMGRPSAWIEDVLRRAFL